MNYNNFKNLKFNMKNAKDYQHQIIKQIKEYKYHNKKKRKKVFKNFLETFNAANIDDIDLTKSTIFDNIVIYGFKLGKKQYYLLPQKISIHNTNLFAGIYGNSKPYISNSITEWDMSYTKLYKYFYPIYIKKGFFNKNVRIFKKMSKLFNSKSRIDTYNKYYLTQKDEEIRIAHNYGDNNEKSY